MMSIVLAIALTLLAWQIRPVAVDRWINANRRLTIALLAAASAAAGVPVIATGGTRETAITPALLQRATQAAEAAGGGYDYSCRLYAAPRQILCEGEGASVAFLVSPSGQLQLEPETG
jgi:hypothetical protein